MKSNNYPKSRKENLVLQESDGEVLIYDMGTNKAFCLNETSAVVWQACDGNKSVGEIATEVAGKFNGPANEDLVWLALEQLKKERLLENADSFQVNFNGVSRREAIKRVGLSTLMALPVVMAITTPVAAAAGSTICGSTLNAACQCNLNGGIPGGPPTPFDQYCTDVSNTCMTAVGVCQCFVPASTAQDGATLQYPGTCQSNP